VDRAVDLFVRRIRCRKAIWRSGCLSISQCVHVRFAGVHENHLFFFRSLQMTGKRRVGACAALVPEIRMQQNEVWESVGSDVLKWHCVHSQKAFFRGAEEVHLGRAVDFVAPRNLQRKGIKTCLELFEDVCQIWIHFE